MFTREGEEHAMCGSSGEFIASLTILQINMNFKQGSVTLNNYTHYNS